MRQQSPPKIDFEDVFQNRGQKSRKTWIGSKRWAVLGFFWNSLWEYRLWLPWEAAEGVLPVLRVEIWDWDLLPSVFLGNRDIKPPKLRKRNGSQIEAGKGVPGDPRAASRHPGQGHL